MTVEALSLTICLASGIFGRPAWTPEKCTERAGQILSIAERHGLDPLLMVAVNIQECDMREDVSAYVRVGTGSGRRVVAVDACPMGVRFWGARALEPHDPQALYELAAQRMERWKRWCERDHRLEEHHFISHYNQGNPVYSSQVLGVLAAITHRKLELKHLLAFTDRTREIVRRLTRTFRGWWTA
jgi:hypothetical protein